MVRRSAPLMVALALPAVLPASAAARSERAATGPRWTATVVRVRDPDLARRRTAVVACDHRAGRRLVLRRALFTSHFGRGTGRVIAAAATARGRVTWLEGAFAGKRATARVFTYDPAARRTLRRRTVWRGTVVTRASYGGDEGIGVMRACLRADGDLVRWTAGGVARGATGLTTTA